MINYCTHCKRFVKGEESDDPLLPPATICEVCGQQIDENNHIDEFGDSSLDVE